MYFNWIIVLIRKISNQCILLNIMHVPDVINKYERVERQICLESQQEICFIGKQKKNESRTNKLKQNDWWWIWLSTETQ